MFGVVRTSPSMPMELEKKMSRKAALTKIVFAGVCLFCSILSNLAIALGSAETAQAQCSQELNGKVKVKVGIFISSLYNLDFKDNSYSMDFWIWWKYDNHEDAPWEKHPVKGHRVYIPFKQIEIINKQSFELEKTYQEVGYDDSVYVMAKFNARINQKWDFSHFPFDTQKIIMELESVEYDSSKLDFIADDQENDFIVSNDVRFAKWKIEPGLKLETCDKIYESSFGGDKPGIYSRIKMTANLSRNINSLLFLDTYLGFFLAFIMCCVLFFLDLEHLADRIGVIFAATISAIGQKQILQINFPNSVDSAISNVIQTTTFSIILITLICSISCNKLVKTGVQENLVFANKIHWTVFAIIVIVFLLAVGLSIASHLI